MASSTLKTAGILVVLVIGAGAVQEASKPVPPKPTECKASKEASDAMQNQQATINNLTTIVTTETETLKKAWKPCRRIVRSSYTEHNS